MSHNICHRTYTLNCDKKKVQAELDHYVAMEDWQEGCSGLANPIRWLDVTLDNYDQAIKYIEDHDRGWYDCLAVKYKSYPQPKKKSRALIELDERIHKAAESRDKIVKDGSIHNRTSEFIGCPKCGSRLKLTLVHGENCPLCRTDLRSPTTLDRYKKSVEKIDRLIKERNGQVTKESAPVVGWLVKIEYHT